MNKAEKAVSLVLHSAVVVMEIIALCLAWPRRGFGVFIYFTELSNLFGAVACFCMAVYLIREMVTGKAIPQWVRIFKYMGACALALTFFTVIFVLAPLAGGTAKAYVTYLTANAMLYTHTLNPLVVMLSFLFLDEFETRNFKVKLLAIIPTVLYEIVSITMNVFYLWNGPYPFLKVHDQPVYMSVIWFLVMSALSFGLCSGLYDAKRGINKKQR